jgi:hypothetical protein
MLQRNTITAVIAACFAGLLTTPAAAQTMTADSIVRITEFNVDSSWHVEGRLVGATPNSLSIRTGPDALITINRFQISHVEQHQRALGKGAVIGCAVAGGALLGLGLLSSGGSGNDKIGAAFAVLAVVPGCVIGGMIGGLAALTRRWHDVSVTPPLAGAPPAG